MKPILLLLLALIISFGVSGQIKESGVFPDSSLIGPVSANINNIKIFDAKEPLDLTLKYDITSFIRHKFQGEYLDAEFRLHLNETDSIVKNIRLKARGNFRRGHCFFPPIYLNFKTDPILNSELEGYKKIKLVTHCSGSKNYQSYIYKEYLAYKLYNLFTDKSFRVRLLNITYIDTGKKSHNYKQIGFLIEPIELVIDRTNSVEVNSQLIQSKNIIESEMDMVALFQYMIGNTDWRAKGGHNIKYMKSLKVLTEKVTPVPYDYDYSGFVDADYAIPQEWTSVDYIYEREYLGYCRNDEAYRQVINKFVRKKTSVYETIQSFPYLNEKEKKKLIHYIDGFYSMVEKPDVLIYRLKKECREMTF